MKPILFSFLFLFITKLGFSQVAANNELVLNPEDKLEYLDSINVETKSKDYVYIRVVKDSKLKKDSYVVQEYYRSGAMRMEGISSTNDGRSKEGDVTYYYKNGSKKSLANYTKGRVGGQDFEWYENGTKKLEGEYADGEKKGSSQHKINQFWDVNGVQKVVDGNGFFEDKNEKESSKGEIKNGLKEGTWEGTILIAKFKSPYKEIYENGKLISGRSWDKNNNFYIYTELEVKPEPSRGMPDFYKYIARNYKMPNVSSLTGKVYVTFIVDAEGKIVEPKILRDIGFGTGQEALRILPNYDGFNPGMQRGQKVRCSFSLPITIQTAY